MSGVFFKFHHNLGVEEWIVDTLYGLRNTDQLFKYYALTRVVRSLLRRLFNAYFEVKFKKHLILGISINENFYYYFMKKMKSGRMVVVV
jgi:hypothetical protein